MAIQAQIRRGNTSQHSTFTGAEGELSVNTDKDILVVHDGVTAGGHEVARVNNPYFNGNVDFSNATFSSNLIPSANITYSLGSSTKRWANLYLSGNTIVIGDQSISSNSTTLLLGNTVFSGALDSTTVGGNTASNLNTYADNKAANAYSNATSYADGRIIDSVTNTSITYAASANSVKNAYDRAIDANTRAGSAQTAAASAYSNAVSYADSKIIDSVTNTSTAYAASANSVKNAYDRAIDANTRAGSAQTAAASAYSNAVSYVDTANFTRTGVTTFSANIILGSSGLSSNGSFGTSGQVLSSNGTAVYWATAGGGGISIAKSYFLLGGA
jgi:hypothetical protein